MTVAELIARLQTLPPDTLLARSCGGDCPGYTELGEPRPEILYPSPDGDSSYGGELVDGPGFDTIKRCDERRNRSDLPEDYWTKTYPKPTGKTYYVF